MGLIGSLRQWIRDAKAVWRSQGSMRPFTRRGMTESEILEEYKRTQDNTTATTDRRRSGKNDDPERG